MIVVTCISKIRDNNNNIIGYILEDKAGVRRKVNASELKNNIQSGNVRCINIKLTSDRRLVDCTDISNCEMETSNFAAYKKIYDKSSHNWVSF